jgi:co-chaperonin GroES (HSP10)
MVLLSFNIDFINKIYHIKTMHTQGNTTKNLKSGDIAVQAALPDTDSEIMMEFKVDNITLIGSYTQVSFEVEAKKLITLPNAVTVTATQKGRNLKQTIRKGVCSVYKGGETFRGNLINKDHALNSSTNFILLMLKNGTRIKINQPEKILSTPDIVQVHANTNSSNVKINMLLENAVISEFKHRLNEVLNIEDDDREPGFYLEQAVILNNESPYNFCNNNIAKIAVPVGNGEQGDNKVENSILSLNNIGNLDAQCKEMIIFSELKMDFPRYYNVVSLVCHDKTHIICEFTLPDDIYPGNITQYLPNGEVVNVSSVPYVKKGEKIFLKQGVTDHIIVKETKTDDNSFTLSLENTFEEIQLVRLREMKEITNLKVDGIPVDDDIMSISKGLHMITGNYKTTLTAE